MTARVPGVLGYHSFQIDTELPEPPEIRWDWHRVPTANHSHSPEGLRLGPDSHRPKKKPQTKSTKATVLIIFGKGQMDMYDGIKIKTKKQFEAGALDFFKDYTKNQKVEAIFVNSVSQMVKAIERQNWDVVIYLGHAYSHSKKLAPGYTDNADTGGLSEDQLATALKKSKVNDVYLFGCRAGWTGLGRSLSKHLPGVNVRATFNDLDIAWEQSGITTRKGKIIVKKNEFTKKEEITEYKNGFQVKNGIKTSQRKLEIDDPLPKFSDNVNPLDEPMVNQKRD